MRSALPQCAPPGRVACAARRPRSGSVDTSHEAETGPLFFVLERRGDGWGEEILPSGSLQRRVEATRPPPDDRLLRLLLDATELDEAGAEDVLSRATAWRTTSSGRQLLDRKLQRAAQRNAPLVLRALRGSEQVGSLLSLWPSLLLLDAKQPWEAHFCRLAGRLHAAVCGRHLVASEADSAWEAETRELARLDMLPAARRALLDGVGFDYGLCDREWELRFDDFLEVASHTAAPSAALAEWVRRQRALHRLGSLPPGVVARLRKVGFPLEERTVPAEEVVPLGWSPEMPVMPHSQPPGRVWSGGAV